MNLPVLNYYQKIIPCLFLIGNLFSLGGCIHEKKYTTSNLHSHNDYENDTPFYRAYKNGYGSIEADIFPVNGNLLVAHKKEEIQGHRTLKALYLEPLLKELSANTSGRINLLVDIKNDYRVALPMLIRELGPLKQYLSTQQVANRLTIIISGTQPPPAEYVNYPDYIYFDDDLKLPHSPEEWKRVALVSLPFNKRSSWKGENRIPREDLKRLRRTVDSAHSADKMIRFWAAPDNIPGWKLQMKLHTDFIGTDKIDELGNFVRSRQK